MTITAEQLLINKGLLEEKTGEKYATLEIKSLKELLGDGQIKIKSLDVNKIQEIGKQTKNEYNLEVRVVYNSVVEPNLKDKGLQNGLGCRTSPFSVVEKIFSPLEIKAIAEKVADISGFKEVKESELIEEVKK